MSHYSAETLWERKDADFLDNRYSRLHLLRFDGGLEVPGSSSPSVVPLPMSDASALDQPARRLAEVPHGHQRAGDCHQHHARRDEAQGPPPSAGSQGSSGMSKFMP
jgi:hypothetical protein